MHLRFTIRDLLWLTLVVALAAAWWLDHRPIMDIRPRQVLLESGGRTYIFNYPDDVLWIKDGGKWSLHQMHPAPNSEIQAAADALR